MLKRVCDSMVLAYDDDDAGHKATVKVAGMMLALEVPVRVVSIPDGDDPDSYLRKHGSEAFRALIDNAESIVSFQVRSERAKERDSGSIDAVARVSKAVLATIAQCRSAILRESMVGEASKLLGLPALALREELGKMAAGMRSAAQIRKPKEGPSGSVAAETEDDIPAAEGADAGAVAPPPPREMALMEFLMANDRNRTLDEMVGEFLPQWVFVHDFTRRFVEAWRVSVATGEDALATFAQGLQDGSRGIYDRIVGAGSRAESCGKTAPSIMQEFVIFLWMDAMKRRQGELPESGTPAEQLERIEISSNLMRLNMVKWNTVKEMIRKMIKEGDKWT